MEIHKGEKTLPEIKDEASCGTHFKGFNGPLTGVSLLVKNRPAFHFEEDDDGWTGNWADGKTFGAITSSSFNERGKIQLLQTRLNESMVTHNELIRLQLHQDV